MKLSYKREIRGLSLKEVDSEDRCRDMRSCQPTPGEEGGVNLDKSSRRSALLHSEIKATWCILFIRGRFTMRQLFSENSPSRRIPGPLRSTKNFPSG